MLLLLTISIKMTVMSCEPSLLRYVNTYPVISSTSQGHPSDKGLDQSGFQTVLTGALEKNYRSKFRQKKKFVKWATSFFRKYGTSNSGFLSFSEFVTVCQEILKDPKVASFPSNFTYNFQGALLPNRDDPREFLNPF